MPLFAYRCRACGAEFQTLVTPGETPACKACASADLERQLSLIASPAKGGEMDAGGCGDPACDADADGCCGGVCRAFAEA